MFGSIGIIGAAVTSAATTDPYFSSVIFLPNFNIANNSTSIPDSSSSGLTSTCFGNAHVGNPSPFSTPSLVLDGSGDYAMTSGSSLLNLNGVNGTTEFWVNVADFSNGPYLGHFFTDTSNRWAIALDTSGHVVFYNSSPSTSASSAGSISLNTDAHIEVSMSSAYQLRMFINGTLSYSNTPVGSLAASGSPRFELGAAVAFSANYLNAGILAARITRGVVRNTANFTPPPPPFPTS